MSILDKITDKFGKPDIQEVVLEESEKQQQVESEVDHLWMKEDLDANKPTLKKDPRVDTGILRNRIAEKIAKMNNY